VDESTRKALEEMQKEAAAEEAADKVADPAQAEETPMQRMQREALEEQAAADAGQSGAPEETPMQRMQREALEEQAAADGGPSGAPEETPMQRMQREALEEQASADGDSSEAASAESMEAMQQEALAEQSSSDQSVRQTKQLKEIINRYMFDMKSTGGKVVNYSAFFLIVATVAASMLNTMPEIHAAWDSEIITGQIVILSIFTIEYLLRIYSAHDRRKYMFSVYGIIDFLTVLPLLFGGPGSAIMRLFRLFRIVKLAQYFPVLTTLLRSVSDATNMIFAVLATIFGVSVFSGNLAYILEPETFHDAFIGTWWSLVTMSTVGYGDLVPHTASGMLLGSVLILIGICVVAMMTAVIAVRVGRMVNMTNICFGCDKPVSPEFKFCPYCGQDQSDDIDLFTDDE